MGRLKRKLWRDALSLRKGISAELDFCQITLLSAGPPGACLTQRVQTSHPLILTQKEVPLPWKPDVGVRRGLSQSGTMRVNEMLTRSWMRNCMDAWLPALTTMVEPNREGYVRAASLEQRGVVLFVVRMRIRAMSGIRTPRSSHRVIRSYTYGEAPAAIYDYARYTRPLLAIYGAARRGSPTYW